MKKRKFKLGLFFKSFLIYYLSNIIIYFIFLRPKLIEGAELLYESDGSREVFELNNITKQDLLNSALFDHRIFNPILNIAYSVGNRFLLIPSTILVILFIIIVKFKNRKKTEKPSINVDM